MRCIEPYHSKSVRSNHRGSELDNVGKKNQYIRIRRMSRCNITVPLAKLT